MRSGWLLAPLIAVVVAVLGARTAHADDREGARAEFKAGQEADARKDYAGAIPHYLRAYELAPHPNALYNAAVDYERIGDLRSAATFYGRYLDEAGDEADDRPKVERLIEALRKKPSRVSIRTTPPGGAITIDDQPAGQAPVTRDLAGGVHVITATTQGRRAQRQISVEYGEPAEVVIPLVDQQGTLSVSSNVSGALVEIDGAAQGTTPLTITVAAGDRQVVVRGDGYATLERSVHVPAEGSAQINAILVRPVGYVEPVSATKTYVFAVDGGRVLNAEQTVVHLGFGYRFANWEVQGRLGFFGEQRYGYGLLVRRYFGESRLKPYIGGSAEYGGGGSSGSSTAIGIVGGHVGLAVEIATFPKMVAELTVDGGAALFASDEEKLLGFPIIASVAFRGK
jgi:hypothetical protein